MLQVRRSNANSNGAFLRAAQSFTEMFLLNICRISAIRAFLYSLRAFPMVRVQRRVRKRRRILRRVRQIRRNYTLRGRARLTSRRRLLLLTRLRRITTIMRCLSTNEFRRSSGILRRRNLSQAALSSSRINFSHFGFRASVVRCNLIARYFYGVLGFCRDRDLWRDG